MVEESTRRSVYFECEEPQVRLEDDKKPAVHFDVDEESSQVRNVESQDGDKPAVRFNDDEQSSQVRNVESQDGDKPAVRFNDDEESSQVRNVESQDGDKPAVRFNDDEQSSRVRFGNVESHHDDDEPTFHYSEEAEAQEYIKPPTPATSLEVGILSTKRLRRRSMLMRMQDDEDDVLPNRSLMLKSQRNVCYDDDEISFGDDNEDNDQDFHSMRSIDFEQSSKPMKSVSTPKNNHSEEKDDSFTSDGFFRSFRSFKKLKNLPQLQAPIKAYDSRNHLTQEEMLRYQEENMSGFSNVAKVMILISLIIFGSVAIGVGYTMGQKG